jgi:hypothetical protein
MKCPKCGFVSHDYLDACRKCSIDLTDFKAQMNLRVVRPGAIDLMAAFERTAVGLKANASDIFSSQMLVQSDENLDDSNDDFDISLDDDFSAFNPDQLEHVRSGEPAAAGTDITFDLSDEDDTAPTEHEPPSLPPTTGYATVMIDVSTMEDMFGDDKTASGATATPQKDEPPAPPEDASPEPPLATENTIAPNTAMLDLAGLNEPTSTPDSDDMNHADTTALDFGDMFDPDATLVDTLTTSDLPRPAGAAPVEPDDALPLLEAEPVSPSKDISLPHTVERTMVLDDLDAFELPAAVDATEAVAASDSIDASTTEDTIVDVELGTIDTSSEDTIVDVEPGGIDTPSMDQFESSAVEAPTPLTASFSSTEIDLEPDEASAANPTAALEIPDAPADADMELSDLDFDLEADLLHFDSQEQETHDLDINFISTETPQPSMPQAHDMEEMSLELDDDFDLEDDEEDDEQRLP